MPRLTTPLRNAVRASATSAHRPAPHCARHAPERMLLYALVQAHCSDFIARPGAQDRPLPAQVRDEFEAYLRCGVLEHGVLRVVCEHCHADRRLASSRKNRGFCPSCGARRMAESARHLLEEVFGPRPVRRQVLSVPFPLRLLFANKPEAVGPVLAIVHRVIGRWLADRAGIARSRAKCGAVTLIQRFGSALNLNIHFHSYSRAPLVDSVQTARVGTAESCGDRLSDSGIDRANVQLHGRGGGKYGSDHDVQRHRDGEEEKPNDRSRVAHHPISFRTMDASMDRGDPAQILAIAVLAARAPELLAFEAFGATTQHATAGTFP